MQININDQLIEQMVKEKTEEAVRKRIKEMQGDYTSKAFIEDIIRTVIWRKILELCPDVENYIKKEVNRCIDYWITNQEDIKISKKELVENIVESLLESFKYVK